MRKRGRMLCVSKSGGARSEERRKEMQQRDDERRAREQEANEERKRQNKLDEEAKQQRMNAIQERCKEMLQDRRVRAIQKQQRQQAAFERIQGARRLELDQTREANAQKLQVAKETREARDIDAELARRTKFEDAQKRSAAFFRSKLLEADRQRREAALKGLISREEHYRASERLANQRVAVSREYQRRYEVKLKVIDEREQLKRRMQIESQRRRDELERQKADLEDRVISPSDINKKGPGRLGAIAEKFRINLAELRERAKTCHRGRAQSQSGSPPPPAAQTL
jgi:hypothetical protein